MQGSGAKEKQGSEKRGREGGRKERKGKSGASIRRMALRHLEL